MEVKLQKNQLNNWIITYFNEQKKHKIECWKTKTDALLRIEELSNFRAERTFKGNTFEVYSW